jgi:DNA-binding NarL/FixJ family response regulator
MTMATAQIIRVLLVDDNLMIRQGLRSLLRSRPNVEVIAEAGDGEEAVASAATLQPAVVIMDIAMPKMDGITATRLIKAQNPEIVVVGLSLHPKDYEVHALQQAGAFDVLRKDNVGINLYGAIERGVAAVQASI